MSLIFSFTLAMLLTAALMPTCVRYAGRIGLIDGATTDRKVHKGVMPRSGGVALVVGTGIAWLVWLPSSDELLLCVPLLVCILLIAILGLLDDRFDLQPRWKLMVQVAVASVLVGTYGGFSQFPFLGIEAVPAWVSMPLTILFVAGVTNAVNLSDGLDGLAAGNCLLSLAFLGLIAAQAGDIHYAAIVLAVVGGLLGFLRFNTHPARVFMGDTGSLFLGFTAAALTVLILRSENTAVSPALPLLIFLMPIIDTSNVIVRRWAGGRPILGADRSHLHHQLLELGYRHHEAVMALYACQAAALALAWPLRHQSDLMIVAIFAACTAAVLAYIEVAQRRGWKAHQPSAAPHDRRRSLLRKLPWYRGRSREVVTSLLIGAFFIGAMEQVPPTGVETLAVICAGLFLVAWAMAPSPSDVVCRLICYSVAALLVYGRFTTGDAAFHVGIDGLLLLTAAALVIGLRVTRKRDFHLDSQDYLMLLVVAGVLLVSLDRVDHLPLAYLLLRLVIILYAIEFVLARRTSLRLWLNAGGIAALGLLAA